MHIGIYHTCFSLTWKSRYIFFKCNKLIIQGSSVFMDLLKGRNSNLYFIYIGYIFNQLLNIFDMCSKPIIRGSFVFMDLLCARGDIRPTNGQRQMALFSPKNMLYKFFYSSIDDNNPKSLSSLLERQHIWYNYNPECITSSQPKWIMELAIAAIYWIF